MNYQHILVTQTDHVVSIALNRPELRNAFNDVLINELTQAVNAASSSDTCRIILIKGNGKAFCAGGDLNWMKASIHASHDENMRDAHQLSLMLQSITNSVKPVIAYVHGAVMGGGTGLVAACDYVIADAETTFAFSEVKLGLVPAVIGPFVLAQIGVSATKAYFTTGLKFSAERALQIGLIHEIAHHEKDCEDKLKLLISNLSTGGPKAISTIKKYISELTELHPSKQHDLAIKTLAHVRVGQEAQDGMLAFLDKKRAPWTH